MRDVKGDQKKVLSQALGLFKVYLCTRDPIPSEMGEADLADDAWNDVCSSIGIDLLISDDNRTTVSYFIYLMFTYYSFLLDYIWCISDSQRLCYENTAVHDRFGVWVLNVSSKKHVQGANE